MRILSARVEHARYARDFGQVEAVVAFLVKEAGRPVPFTRRLRTSVDARGDQPLRQRLIASAQVMLDAVGGAAVSPAAWASAALPDARLPLP
jgi:hypothetical protein